MTTSAPGLWQVLLVEDDAGLRKGIGDELNQRFPAALQVILKEHRFNVEDWIAQDPLLPDCAVVDINLRDASHGLDKYEEMTELDGFAVLSLLSTRHRRLRVGLYTGWEPAKRGLHFFDKPDSLFWVVRKGSAEDTSAAFRIAATYLREVAMEVLLRQSPQARRTAFEVMTTGATPAPITVEGRTFTGRSVKRVLPWSVVLAPLMRQDERPEAVLERFCAFRVNKLRVFAAWLDPDRLGVSGAGYGLSAAQSAADFSLPVSRPDTLFNRTLHPYIFSENPSRHYYDTLRKQAQTVGRSELAGLQGILLEPTAEAIDTYLAKCVGVKSPHVPHVELADDADCLKKSLMFFVADLLQAAGLPPAALPHNFRCMQYRGEAAALASALAGIRQSMFENSGRQELVYATTVTTERAPEMEWVLAIWIASKSRWMGDVRAAFLTGAANRASVSYPDAARTLQKAQGQLWGYCEWTAFTRDVPDSPGDAWNVYEECQAGTEFWDALPESLSSCNEPVSGHRVVLRFPIPVSLRGEEEGQIAWSWCCMTRKATG